MVPSTDVQPEVRRENISGIPLIRPELLTCPWIRESNYSNTFQIRLRLLNYIHLHPSIGPSDLINWNRYYGERLSKFTTNEFGSESPLDAPKRDADGYVGYYHFCNGIDYTKGATSIERYVVESIGLVWNGEGYYRGPLCLVGSVGTTSEKPMILTHSVYNVFLKAEVRTRLNINVPKGSNPSYKLTKQAKGSPADVSCQYTFHFLADERSIDHTSASVQEVDQLFWDELAALSLIRLVLCTDDPSQQLCGTVNLPDLVMDPQSLMESIRILVSLIPRGNVTGTRESFGSVASTGLGSSHLLKLTTYRNHLVDTLVRVCSIDTSGALADIAIAQIASLYGHDFDYVICQLLKTQHTRNNTTSLLTLLHDYFELETQLCQAALLLVEQSQFLVGQGSVNHARYIAAQAVQVLPLDFDCWYQLLLCYILERDFTRALETINLICITFRSNVVSVFDVNGTFDTYASRWAEHTAKNRFIDLRTFESFFRPPTDGKGIELASMNLIWHKSYQYEPHTRKPVCGSLFTSPLDLASPREASAVGYEIQDVIGTNSVKLSTAAKSANQRRASVLDYEHRSTWGRVYDLLTMIVALIGWDNTCELRDQTFIDEEARVGIAATGDKEYVVNLHDHSKKPMSRWLLQMLDIVYEDLRATTSLSETEHRSALAWEMIGFAGWGCKSNLRETISALITSTSTYTEGRFAYFSTVKLLQIYNEFVLSDVTSSALDQYTNVYSGTHNTNKLIVKFFLPQVYAEFVRLLVMGHFTLENILMYLVKVCSWNVRWYGYLPPGMVVTILQKLCIKYETAVIRETLRILFMKFRKSKEKLSGAFTLREMFAPPKNQTVGYEFEDNDTVDRYMENLMDWIDMHNSQK